MKKKTYLYCFLILQIIALSLHSFIHFGSVPVLFGEYNKVGHHSGQVFITDKLYKENIEIPEKFKVHENNKRLHLGLSIKQFKIFDIPYYIAFLCHLLSFIFLYLYIKLKSSTQKLLEQS